MAPGRVLALVLLVLLTLATGAPFTLTEPLFEILGHEFSGRDLILILGGLFLLAKATYEIHDKLEGETGHKSAAVAASSSAVSSVAAFCAAA